MTSQPYPRIDRFRHPAWMPGRLPRTLEPAEGEAFPGFVLRLAAAHGCSLGSILEATGLADGQRFEMDGGYGVDLAPDRLRRFSHATGITPGRVTGMMLSSLDGLAIDLRRHEQGSSRSMRAHAQREWAYFGSSHYCPRCLEETHGVWQLHWRLPYVFACVRHRCMLMSHCPACRQRGFMLQRDGRLKPLFLDQVPIPGRCLNPRPWGESPNGRAARPCNFDLCSARAADLDGDSPLLAIQAEMDDVLSGATTDAKRSAAMQLFAELRSMIALCLYGAQAPWNDGRALSPIQDALMRHVQERERRREERSRLTDYRTGRRTRLYIGAPECPLLVASIMPQAWAVVRASDPSRLREALRPVALLAARIQRDHWQLLRHFHCSPRLQDAYRSVFVERGGFDRVIGQGHASSAGDQAAIEAVATRLPPLALADDFDVMFKHLLPGFASTSGRRFVTLATLKSMTGATWAQCGESLGIGGKAGTDLGNRGMTALRQAGARQEFAGSLDRYIARFTSAQVQIDYGERSRQVQDLHLRLPADWPDLCRLAGIRPGDPGKRVRLASIWLWSRLTLRPWEESPVFHGSPPTETESEVFRHFLKRVLPAVHRQLVAWCESTYGIRLEDLPSPLATEDAPARG